MPKTLDIFINIGSENVGLNLLAQVINSSGLNISPLISDGFTEIGSGYYVWRYSNFPENTTGGIKFFEQSDSSTVISFSEFSTTQNECTTDQSCSSEIGSYFDITYSDQSGVYFYAILFAADDLTKAWNPSINNFEKYSIENQGAFILVLQEDSNRTGWYSYSIKNIENIPPVIGNQFYFVEVWQKKGTEADRTKDINTGNTRVCWGKQSGDFVEIAKNVWDYKDRTLTSDLYNFDELKKSILDAIVISTGKTIEELSKVNSELSSSIEKTFTLLEECCSSKPKGTPTIQSPKIGPKGSRGPGSDMRFSG